MGSYRKYTRQGNDAIIGKLMPIKNRADKHKYKDSSTLCVQMKKDTLTKYLSRNDDGFRVCKSSTRSIQFWCDKFSSSWTKN